MNRLVQRAVDLRPGEGPPIAWAFAQFLLLLSGLYVVRPLRDAMGIASGVANMQWLFSGTFVAILAVVPLYGWAVSRWSRRRLVPLVHACLAGSMVVCFGARVALPDAVQPAVAAAIFIWVSVFNVLAVSVFWSLLADLFSPEASRRTFGFVASGGTIGALLGPTLAATFVAWLRPADLLLVAAACLVGAAWCAHRLDRAAGTSTERDETPVGGGLWQGLSLMFATPRLRGIAGYMLCMTWISTILYFEQAHIVEAAVLTDASRTSLFARMDLAVNLLALVVQLLLTGRIILRWGLVVVLVALPVVSIGALATLAAFPALAVIVVVQVARRAVNFALAKPAREVLFTDVAVEAKYKGKNVVDTVVYRGGDAVAGWAFSGLRGLGLGLSAIAWLGIPVTILWAWLGQRLGQDATR